MCAQLSVENHSLTAKLRELYEEQNAVFQEAETYKVERDNLVMRKVLHVFATSHGHLLMCFMQAGIQDEIKVALDTNSRTKARIVQSPERLKRIISTMGDNVVEERRNIAANEAKARALRFKLDNLATYEQVGLLIIVGC